MKLLPIHYYIPRAVYDDEAALAFWLRCRYITGFFWEVVQYGDWVVIEEMTE